MQTGSGLRISVLGHHSNWERDRDKQCFCLFVCLGFLGLCIYFCSYLFIFFLISLTISLDFMMFICK